MLLHCLSAYFRGALTRHLNEYCCWGLLDPRCCQVARNDEQCYQQELIFLVMLELISSQLQVHDEMKGCGPHSFASQLVAADIDRKKAQVPAGIRCLCFTCAHNICACDRLVACPAVVHGQRSSCSLTTVQERNITCTHTMVCIDHIMAVGVTAHAGILNLPQPLTMTVISRSYPGG